MALNPKHCCKKNWHRYIQYTVTLLLSTIFHSITVAQPNVSFATDKDGGCPPFSIQFTNNTSGVSANATYRWDFGNGNTSELRDAASIYTESQTYTVTLTVTDAGQTYTYAKDITGYKKPSADFSVSPGKACIPAVINFTSNSTPGSGALTRFYWDFGDGTTQEEYSNTTSHTYMALLKPSVTLTVTNEYGCNSSVSKHKVAEILPAMAAVFSSSQQVLCKPTDAVQFTNTSSGPGTLSYEWNFGDGHTSTVKEPSYSFNKKGIFTVSLTVKNTDGCSVTNTQTDYLNVASYTAGFDAPALICKDVPVNFTRTSNPLPTSTVWYVDGQAVNYWEGYLNASFNVVGDHDIKIENTFGTCADTYSTKVNVKPTPEMSEFTADIQANCGPPAVVKFKDNTAGAVKWEWNFNWNNYSDNFTSFVQAPSFTYNSEGAYTALVKVTNVHGCSNTIAENVYISKPYAYIDNVLNTDENTRCGYKKVQMSVTGSSEEIVTYKWHLGDGTTSTEKQPVKEYTQPGSYHIYLEYTTKSGCKGVSNNLDFSVYKKPKADFVASPGTTICGNTPMNFVYTGTGPYENTNWYLDGQYMASGTSPIQFSEEKIYDVTLYVYNGNCGDTLTKLQYLTVKLPFPAITSVVNTCNGTRGEVAFTQASKGATSIIWDFGDGTTPVTTPGDQLDIKHLYTKTGQFPVTLTAINAACSVKTLVNAYVLLKQPPKLTANKPAVCPDEQLTIKVGNYEKNPWVSGPYPHFNMQFQYEDESLFTGGVGTLNGYWDWTNEFNGNLTGFQSIKQKLRVITTSSVAGCVDTSNFIPLVIKGAAAAFDIVKDKQCFAAAVVLKDASIANNNTITSWKWDFGDGQSQSVTQSGQVTHNYDNPGSYNVQLTITDAGGCSSTSPPYSKTVEVYGPKTAFGVSGNNVPLNTTVQFYNYTNVYGSNNTAYTWDFGDGTKGTEPNEQHTYPQPGTYIVKLTAKDAITGCVSEAPEHTIVVRYFNSAFQYTTSFVTGISCAPVVARFTNTSYDYTKIIWDFGDGSGLLEDVNYPSHVYKESGTYIVNLMVYGYNGLKGEYKDTIVINQPAASLKVSPQAICKGQSAKLLASGKSISSYAWDFGDGNVVMGNDSTISHVYNTTGTFKPQILVTDMEGCTGAGVSADLLTVSAGPVISIVPAQPRICRGDKIQLIASGAVTYTWEPANGLSSLQVANPLVSPDITTTYSLHAKDALGCTADATRTVTVVQREQLRTMDDTGICFGKQVQLSVSGTSKYQWIKQTTGLSNTQIPDPMAQPSVTTTYTVVGGDEYGCFSDTADIKVSVYPLPTVNAGNDVETLAGTPVQLKATGSADISAWLWSPDKYLACSDCPAPLAKPLATTEYTITVKTVHGCMASDAVVLKMECEAGKVYIPNAFTPGDDGKNDLFMIRGIGIVKHLVIYNRYGKKVFEKNNFIASDRSSAWDGTLNGQALPTGSFVYFAEMECPSGGVFMRKGTVTLIR